MLRNARSFIVVFLLGIASAGSAHLPNEVLEQINLQSSEIVQALSKLNEKQHNLLIERYAELIVESPLFVRFDVKPDELLKELHTRFPHRESAVESKFKKAKELNLFDEKTSHYVDMLIKKFAGSVKGDSLDLRFTCGGATYELPFEIIEAGAYLGLRLNGVERPEPLETRGTTNNCLNMQFRFDSEYAWLSHIGTKDAACPIPSVSGGNCLLEIAEKISAAIGRKTIKLVDGSAFRCSANKKEVSLRRLKSYQGGKGGWYEAHGYVPVHDAADVQKRLHDFANYPLASLRKQLPRSAQKHYNIKPVEFLSGQLQKFEKAENHETVGQFMSWLWQHDCAAYGEVDAFFSKASSDLSFSRIFPNNSELVKKLPQ